MKAIDFIREGLILRIGLGIILLILANPCPAMNDWVFSGFTTIGINKLNRSNLAFGEVEDEWGFNNDTKIGLQLQGDIIDRLSFTGQVLSAGLQLGENESYEPQLPWLFFSYQFTPNLRARLGRMRASHYIYSETKDIGYSYPWVRPPIDVYSYLIQPISDLNGFDIIYTMDIGKEFEFDTHFFLGRREGTFGESLKVELEPSYGVNFTLRNTYLLLRYSVHFEETSIHSNELKPLISALKSASILTSDPLFGEIASSFYSKDELYIYHGLGVQWDLQNWRTIAEAYLVDNPDSGFSSSSKAWYLSLSYQWSAFTPYAVISAYETISNEYIADDIDQALIDYSYSPTLTTLLQRSIAVNELFSSKQQSYTTGVRWDFMPDLALTAELQYFKFLDDSTGQSRPLDSGQPIPENTTMISIALDWVF